MFWVFLAILIIVFVVSLFSFINRAIFFGLFKKGNVIVTGLRGCGKDMAFCLAINHFKKNYISNVVYSSPKKKYKQFEFDAKVWELAGNSYKDFVEGSVKKFEYPYPDGLDYYISDAGIYFPSQYQGELVKLYKGSPLFQALSRHIGDCNVHCNVQNLNRLWDKIREQSDIYVCMKGCHVFFKRFALLRGCIYETAEACEKRLVPPHYGLGKEGRNRRVMFETANGRIKSFWFFARIPYRYDDRRFKRLLENKCTVYGDSSYEVI